jgi:hypothetical protein
MLKSKSTCLERAPASAIQSKSFAVNNVEENHFIPPPSLRWLRDSSN